MSEERRGVKRCIENLESSSEALNRPQVQYNRVYHRMSM